MKLSKQAGCELTNRRPTATKATVTSAAMCFAGFDMICESSHVECVWRKDTSASDVAPKLNQGPLVLERSTSLPVLPCRLRRHQLHPDVRRYQAGQQSTSA